jgi:hypothetical protein
MPLNREDAESADRAGGPQPAVERVGLVGTVVKFPDEGRIVRFGRADADESATVIILPVIRIERYADPVAESAEPPPPADNSGRRRARRR